MKTKHSILTIGITGGIGSGKTTVCKMFEEMGAKVIYADELAKQIMEEDENIKKGVKEVIGEEAYIEGKLNRKFIASVIFSDDTKKKNLEAIVHPAVIKKIIDEFKTLAEQKTHNFVIVESALIFESGLDRELDYVIVVDADEEEKIKRIMKRDNCTRKEVLNRMKTQMEPKRKKELADIVIQNNSDIDSLRSKVKFLFALFQKISKSIEGENENS